MPGLLSSREVQFVLDDVSLLQKIPSASVFTDASVIKNKPALCDSDSETQMLSLVATDRAHPQKISLLCENQKLTTPLMFTLHRI
ncbi:hypothetical protein ElyMa_006655800 [Elysia marginata]|uniref:Reverse transcriptase/retrotransposon-derived protein RNase H-like domain-containing protein n=1 Tax=Elysia marginata TaxID=1093978 RepID=A0AAV4IEU0_9GAST|nr:hypothetical protein ElyMa_006655800 [Elysia marginata]